MNFRITPEFENLIGTARLQSLNNHPSTVYGLDLELNIAYQNPAFFKFFEDNKSNNSVSNCSPLGQNIFDIIPDVQANTYKELFDSVMNDKETLVSSQFEYECSSSELYRRFSMHLYSLGKDGLLVVNSLLIEEAHSATITDGANILNEMDYIDNKGMLRQCANCRRVQNLNKNDQWDWVPKWIKVAHVPTTHGLCCPCRHHYYPSKKSLAKQ